MFAALGPEANGAARRWAEDGASDGKGLQSRCPKTKKSAGTAHIHSNATPPPPPHNTYLPGVVSVFSQAFPRVPHEEPHHPGGLPYDYRDLVSGACVCVCVDVRVEIEACIYMCVVIVCMYRCGCTCAYSIPFVHARVRVHTYMQVRLTPPTPTHAPPQRIRDTHTHIYIHTYLHTHTPDTCIYTQGGGT